MNQCVLKQRMQYYQGSWYFLNFNGCANHLRDLVKMQLLIHCVQDSRFCISNRFPNDSKWCTLLVLGIFWVKRHILIGCFKMFVLPFVFSTELCIAPGCKIYIKLAYIKWMNKWSPVLLYSQEMKLAHKELNKLLTKGQVWSRILATSALYTESQALRWLYPRIKV